MHSIMANLNLGQDVANKRERKQTAAPLVAKSHTHKQAAGRSRYGSLININPSGLSYRERKGKKFVNLSKILLLSYSKGLYSC